MSEQNDRDIEHLLAAAGQRRNPPEEMRARVYAETLAAWEALPERPPAASARPAVTRWLAAAASVALAGVAGLFWFSSPTSTMAPLAEVAHIRGALLVDGEPAAVGSALADGTLLATDGQSLASITLRNGARLELDVASELRVEEDYLRLAAGRVYVDAHAADAVVVTTPSLTVRDIGTQFEVGLTDAVAAWVAVREGAVDVESASRQVSLSANAGLGEIAHFAAGELAERHVLTSTDARWQWRLDGRAPFSLDGASVYAYLAWMARDSGHTLEFASRAVEQMAKVEYLRGPGTSDDITLDDALRATRFELTPQGIRAWRVDFRDG